jgi:serine/threonine protein kinase
MLPSFFFLCCLRLPLILP